MNDGIDLDTLTTTMDFLMNGISGNGLRPIDLDLEFNRRGDELEIVNFSPVVKATVEESSDDEDDDDNFLGRTIKHASGNYSNTYIEEHWNEISEESSKSTAKKVQLKKGFNMLRETANEMSARRNCQNPNGVEQPQEESNQDNEKQLKKDFNMLRETADETSAKRNPQNPNGVEQPQEESNQDNEKLPDMNQKQNINLKKKKKRLKFKNIAIESILGIKNISTVQPARQENLGAGTALKPVTPIANGPKPPVVIGPKPSVGNGLKPLGRGRGRGKFLTDNSRRNNISMIRPECIHGYHANPDYDPNKPLGNGVPKLHEFPPL